MILKKKEILKFAAEYCRWMKVEKKVNIVACGLEIGEKKDPKLDDRYFFYVIADRVFIPENGSNPLFASSLTTYWAENLDMIRVDWGINWKWKERIHLMRKMGIVPTAGMKNYSFELSEILLSTSKNI